jgi:hypothetical protein
MRVHEFLDLVAQETRQALPPSLRRFRTWKRYTLIQLFYGRRGIHYEVWIRGPARALEIGLHCEADGATNTALLELFDANLFEIKDVLGRQVEAEQWTRSWTRVHELMPYDKLDPATAHECARRLAAMISLLQALLERNAVRPDARAGARRAARASD